LTKKYFDHRFYKNENYKITEYFYPKNSEGELNSFFPILQIFTLQFSEKKDCKFSLILFKNENLKLKFFGNSKNYFEEKSLLSLPKNWNENIFTMYINPNENFCISILNHKLEIEISLIEHWNPIKKEKKIQFFTCNAKFKNAMKINYFRAPIYLGFIKMFSFTFDESKQILVTLKCNWDKKNKNFICVENLSKMFMNHGQELLVSEIEQIFQNENILENYKTIFYSSNF